MKKLPIFLLICLLIGIVACKETEDYWTQYEQWRETNESWFIEQLGAKEDLQVIAGSFAPEDYAICVAKENTELLDKINDALATLKENGTLANIIANYIGEDDVKGTMPYVSSNTDYSNGKLVMVTEATFPPYEYYEGGEGKIVGIDIDMAQAIADLLKMELEVQDIAFDSIVTSVQTGKADIGVAGLTVDEDRLQYVNFTEPYTTSEQVIIVRAK